MIEITTKYTTTCRVCGGEIAKGERAMFDPDGPKKGKMAHLACQTKDAPGTPDNTDDKSAEALAKALNEALRTKDRPGTPGTDLKTDNVTGDGDGYLAEYRVRLDRIAVIEGFDGQYLSAEDAEPLCRHMIGDADREHLIAIALGPDARPVGVHTVSIGTLDMTVGAPREAFKFLCVVGAHRFILAHNHPSPDTTPSRADRRATARMQDVGKLAGIPLVASLIIGRDGNWRDILDDKRDGYEWDDEPDDDGDEGDSDDGGDDGEPGDGDDNGPGDRTEPDDGDGPGDEAPQPEDGEGLQSDEPDNGEGIENADLAALRRFVEG